LRYVYVLLIALPLAAQQLPKCPDNGESSSTRTIRGTTGTIVPIATVPERLRDAAIARYLSFMFGNRQPADAEERIKPTAARKFTFGTTTFYTLTVGNSQTIVSTTCPHEHCTSDWWPADATILADRDRPPHAAPGDEFYAITKDTPKGQAALITSDPTNDTYELVEQCLVTITDTTAAAASACTPDAFTLCLLDRLTIRVEDRSGGGHERARVGARGKMAGTFALHAPAYWDVLVNAFENCVATKTVIIKYVSTNTDPYDLIARDDRTGIEHTYTILNGGIAAKYDNTTFRCK
jgi:hypothetical protein